MSANLVGYCYILGTYWTYLLQDFVYANCCCRYIHWEYVHLPSPPLPLSSERCGFKADVPMWRKVHTRGHHQCKDRERNHHTAYTFRIIIIIIIIYLPPKVRYLLTSRAVYLAQQS